MGVGKPIPNASQSGCALRLSTSLRWVIEKRVAIARIDSVVRNSGLLAGSALTWIMCVTRLCYGLSWDKQDGRDVAGFACSRGDALRAPNACEVKVLIWARTGR